MKFIIYDIILLALFAIFVFIFLYSKRRNIEKQGFLFLYKTTWGIKLINYVGNRGKKYLNVLSYISIGLGYCLMAVVLYLFGKIIWIYVAYPAIVQQIKVPPIMPLIPYLPQVFKLDFLPPFYFVYWIIILAIIAITHEFAHGVLAVHNKIKIKNTGFGFFPFFLPVFLAAFVELDEEEMKKKTNFSQMAILSAGTFANILTAVLFFLILWMFFSFAFTPSGVVFDTYAYSVVGVSVISSVDNISLISHSYDELLESVNETGFSEVEADGNSYLITKEFLEKQKDNKGNVFLFDNAPAINSGLSGVITQINGVNIESKEKLSEELSKYSPGERIILSIYDGEDNYDHNIVLEENPIDKGKAWLGIGFFDQERQGITGRIYNVLSSFKEPNVFYQPKFDGISWFIYNLLWWLVLISISVALINMLPVGLFDGGRFFYLTILGITKSEKKAKKFFSFSTYFILSLVLLLLVFWGLSFFK